MGALRRPEVIRVDVGLGGAAPVLVEVRERDSVQQQPRGIEEDNQIAEPAPRVHDQR